MIEGLGVVAQVVPENADLIRIATASGKSANVVNVAIQSSFTLINCRHPPKVIGGVGD